MATAAAAAGKALKTNQTLLSAARIRDLENRLTPFLENRIRRPQAAATAPAPVRDVDFFMVARSWDRLSPSFQALYKTATQLPPGTSTYISPGQHCEVLYSTTDPETKVSATDSIGYGSSGNWRSRAHGPNGIPDYVDEVAWALDSAWSMEVDRFGFIRPITVKDPSHTSDRYRVVITHFLQETLYGQTIPEGKPAGAPKGYASYVEIRNNWDGSVWAGMGYDLHPENGIRVTCMHEFFHGVQFAMTWSSPDAISLDDFPDGWLEGSAVLMEELGFDSINDYRQYADAFFSDPTVSFIVDRKVEYSNSLLTKFLYEKVTDGPGIDFIKRIFFNNYAQAVPFHQNLRSTSLYYGRQWVTVLNRFHAGTFFTGSRADTVRFLSEAAALPQWSYVFDTIPASFSVSKAVNPYGMEIFAFAPDSSQDDTLSINLTCQTESANPVPPPSWASSCIVRGGPLTDTVVQTPVDDAGRGWMRISGWKSRRELLIIPTNGNPSDQRTATISILACPVVYHAGEKTDVRLNDSGRGGAATATLTALADLRCALTLDSAPASFPSLPRQLVPLSGYFSLSYPSFWGTDAAVSLTISVPGRRVDSLKNCRAIKADSLACFRWNSVSVLWERLQVPAAVSGDTIRMTVVQAVPGIYAEAAPEFFHADTSGRIVIFPNPAHLRRSPVMRFEGIDTTEVRIYSGSGGLVCSSAGGSDQSFQTYKGGHAWKLVNSRGRPVTPGSYIAAVTWREFGEKKCALHRILVFP